jgi:DNA topoisomerase-1
MSEIRGVRKLSRKVPHDVQNLLDGISRKKIGDEFVYFYIKNGKEVMAKDIKRIQKLRIPPAWTDVWISIDPDSSIQAIGIDSKARKQYIYHAHHIEQAEKKKFDRLYHFIKAIPKLENIMETHVSLGPYEKNRVIVTMLQIVRALYIRVGKEQYAKQNNSYGISSLKKTHVRIDNDTVYFRFKGKSGKRLSYTLKDHEISSHIKLLLKLGGPKLFQYISDAGNIVRVTDTDLNQYIQQYMGADFSAKDFRTYAANYFFIKSILQETKIRYPKNAQVIKTNISNAIKRTIFYMKHTKAVSKKSYISNFAIELYQNNPQLFVENKDKDPNEFLLRLLKMYREKVLHVKS